MEQSIEVVAKLDYSISEKNSQRKIGVAFIKKMSVIMHFLQNFVNDVETFEISIFFSRKFSKVIFIRENTQFGNLVFYFCGFIAVIRETENENGVISVSMQIITLLSHAWILL